MATWYKENYKNGYPAVTLTCDQKCDVAIIGGGLAGLSLAYQLGRYDIDFILIERGLIGDSASGLNGGFCSAGWAASKGEIMKKFGKEFAIDFHKISREGLAWMTALIESEAFADVEKKKGCLNVFLDQESELMKNKLDRENLIFDEHAQFISRNELNLFTSSKRYTYGILSDNGFYFNPLKFLDRLKGEILQTGGRIFENSMMEAFYERDGKFIIKVGNNKSIRAERIVLATGGSAGEETGYLRSRWIPLKTYIGVTAPLAHLAKRHFIKDIAISDSRRSGNYYHLLPDTRLMWGRDISAFNKNSFITGLKQVKNEISFFYPDLVNDVGGIDKLSIDYYWYGNMAYSFFKLPYVGQVYPAVFALTAFGGHGMNTAPAAAIVLAEFLAGVSDRVSIFDRIPKSWNGNILGPYAAELIINYTRLKEDLQFVLRNRGV